MALVYKVLYVYILKCSDGSYYTGVTNNLDERIRQHNEDEHETSYTYSRRPVKLTFFKTFADANEAISYEKQIKRWSRAKKEALIANDSERLRKEAVAYYKR